MGFGRAFPGGRRLAAGGGICACPRGGGLM
jgi:hypothetical protein